MKRTALVTSLVTAGVLLAAGGFFIGRLTSEGAAPGRSRLGIKAPTGERKVLYWHDPMVPGPRFDKPGKSPFMDMQLVPVYADDANDTGVKISPTVQQNLGIRTATVKRAIVASFDALERCSSMSV
jgi:Cu(I)/Ag(I) efflux system membrane fusion protein